MKYRYILRGGSTQTVLRDNGNDIRLNMSPATCQDVQKEELKDEDIYYCRKNRSQCLLESQMDSTYKHREKFSSYQYKSCQLDQTVPFREISKQLADYDTIIIGAGPVGLYAGIRMKKQFPDSNVLIIEARESYTRKQIFLIQDGSPAQLMGVTLLKEHGLLDNLLDSGGKYITHPVGDNKAIEMKYEDMIKKTPRNHRVGITVGNFEFTLEKEFLDRGGHIVRPAQIKTKLDVELTELQTLTLTCNDTYMIRLSGNDEIELLSEAKIIKYKNLICADGGRNSFRFKFNKFLNQQPNLEEIFKMNIYSYFDDGDKPEKRRIYPESRNKIEDMNEIKHARSNCYGLIFNFDITEDNRKDIEKFYNAIKHSETNPHKYRLFIVGDQGYFAIQIVKDDFNGYTGMLTSTDDKIKSETYIIIENFHTYNEEKKEEIEEEKEEEEEKLAEEKEPNPNDDNRIKKLITKHIKKSLDFKDDKTTVERNDILNKFINVLKKVQIFPLSIHIMMKNSIIIKADHNSDINVAWIGDAAIGVHFFSGSGVNLGLKTVDILLNSLKLDQKKFDFDSGRFETETQKLFKKSIESSYNIVETFEEDHHRSKLSKT